MSFVADVNRLVRRIPPASVATYGQIAALLGRPRGARAVGWAMRHCAPGVPWHRVVNARGGISLRQNVGSMLTQRVLLEQEGVALRRGRVPLRRYRWQDTPHAPPDAASRQARPREAWSERDRLTRPGPPRNGPREPARDLRPAARAGRPRARRDARTR